MTDKVFAGWNIRAQWNNPDGTLTVAAASFLRDMFANANGNNTVGVVTGLTAVGIEHGYRISATLPNELDLAYVELWMSSDNILAHATRITWGLQSTYDQLGFSASDGTKYFWVRCVNTTDTKGAFVGPVSAIAGITTVPGSVTGLTAVGIAHGIRISATLPADVDLAYVELWMSADSNLAHASRITWGLASSYDQLGLSFSDGTKYFWARCVNTSGGIGAYSGPVNAVAGITTTPGSVASLTATGIEHGIRVSAILPSDADLAYVELWMSADAVLAHATRITWGLASSYDQLGLSASDGVKYFWARCVNTSGGLGAFVGPVNALAGVTTTPGSVTGLTAVGIAGGMRISGTLPGDIDLAYVEIWMGATNVLGAATRITWGLASSYDQLGFAPSDGIRYFWVRCVNTSGATGAFVGPVSATAGVADWIDITGKAHIHGIATTIGSKAVTLWVEAPTGGTAALEDAIYASTVSGTAVNGISTGSAADGTGVFGAADSTTGAGVFGSQTSTGDALAGINSGGGPGLNIYQGISKLQDGLAVTGDMSCTKVITGGVYTVVTLPSAATYPGGRAAVTNALAPVFGAVVAGGGAAAVPVYSDGANWLVG